MKKINFSINSSLFILFLMFSIACNTNTNIKTKENSDSIAAKNDSIKSITKSDTISKSESKTDSKIAVTNSERSKVLIYNFHVTNRCPSCIAIEKATTKTLSAYFATEVKQGRIKRQVLNVDKKANKFISEKYEAFGSGLFVTRVFKGKETTTDLTGDGFKFAKNKEEKFIEILKNKISEYLK
ncbi:MAG: hypothetical protein HGB12_11395 [Bacteroidetes bacterium]|nr:hypothetical protein [Bacteroidota bacterium]